MWTWPITARLLDWIAATTRLSRSGAAVLVAATPPAVAITCSLDTLGNAAFLWASRPRR